MVLLLLRGHPLRPLRCSFTLLALLCRGWRHRSDRDPRDPAPEFVWNSWLRQPLVELGLYDHCPALLQVQRSRLCVLARLVPAPAMRLHAAALLATSYSYSGRLQAVRPGPPAAPQGAVECSAQQLLGSSTKFSMCLVSRRSRRHPGTRYIGALLLSVL